MRYIGLDLGTKTLGISISDETKTIASPLKTLRFSENNNDEVFDELKTIVEEFNVEKIVLKHINDKSVNPHNVNPIYLKLTEAEEKLNDKNN